MPVQSNIELPRDQFAHQGAIAEWWWHVGTLRSGDRLFGFEVNATGGYASGSTGPDQYAFTQIMISDVQNGLRFGQAMLHDPPGAWAQYDPTQPWFVSLGADPKAPGSVRMSSPPGDIWTMQITAYAADLTTGAPIMIDLTLHQEGLPLLVGGTGVKLLDPNGPGPLQQNNYYYSFTRLKAKGVISIGSETFAVEGETWMDHEYGAFSSRYRWVLQSAQLDNKVHLVNFTPGTEYAPQLNVPAPSTVTVLWPNDVITVADSTVTPLPPVWAKPEGGVYYLRYRVQIPELDADLTFTSTIANQEFRPFLPGGDPIFEGNVYVEGTFEGQARTGMGWIEQANGR